MDEYQTSVAMHWKPEFGIRDLGLEKIQKEGSSLVGTVFKDTKELPDGLGRRHEIEFDERYVWD